MMETLSRPSRFWAHTVKVNGCWEWAGKRMSGRTPYGDVSVNGRMTKAHRHAWALAYGPIPDGMLVLHTCDNPPCVNPSHLFLGTNTDNVRDMLSKGRERLPQGSIGATTAAAIIIRLRSGESRRSISDDLGVSMQTVKHIARGRAWSWLNA